VASTTAAKSASTAPAAGASPASNSAIDAAAGAASPASKSAIDAAASPRDVESLSAGAAGLPVLTPGVAPPSAETAAEEEKIRGGEHKPAPLSLLSSQSPVRFDHVQRRRRTRDSDVPYTFSIDGPWGAPTQVRFLFVPSSVAWLPFPRLFTHLSLSLFPFFLSSIPLCSRSLFLLPPSFFSLPHSSPSLFLLPPYPLSLFFPSFPLFSPSSLFFPLPPSFFPSLLLLPLPRSFPHKKTKGLFRLRRRRPPRSRRRRHAHGQRLALFGPRARVRPVHQLFLPQRGAGQRAYPTVTRVLPLDPPR